MYTRGSKFYADYRDERNIRHRKSFNSAALALEFENAQRALQLKGKLKALKAGQRLSPLPPYSARKSNPTRNVKAITGKSRPASSVKLPGTKRPAKSRRRMSPKPLQS
jgi:hypothetical protein